MRFKHRAWIPVVWLLSLANLASVWFAARPGEPGLDFIERALVDVRNRAHFPRQE